MRHGIRIMGLLAAGLLLITGVAAAGSGVKIGGKAPMTNVDMKNVDGKTISIEKAAGKKGTLVVFTCNSCPWVKAWEERMVELGNTYAGKGIGVLFVNSNDPSIRADDGFEAMQERAEKRKMKFAYAVDATSEIARAFGATRTPEAFLFDAKGKLVYHGTIDDNAYKPAEVSKRYLAQALDAVVAGKDIEMAETKALGCAIKFRASVSEEKSTKEKSSS